MSGSFQLSGTPRSGFKNVVLAPGETKTRSRCSLGFRAQRSSPGRPSCCGRHGSTTVLITQTRSKAKTLRVATGRHVVRCVGPKDDFNLECLRVPEVAPGRGLRDCGTVYVTAHFATDNETVVVHVPCLSSTPSACLTRGCHKPQPRQLVSTT
jgi:hypothetical protein